MSGDRLSGIMAFWGAFICDWTHGGGHIERDEQGRINWRCKACGRWGDNPVPLPSERATIDGHLNAALRARAQQEGQR